MYAKVGTYPPPIFSSYASSQLQQRWVPESAYGFHAIFTFCLLLLSMGHSQAQVTVIPVLPPPYSPFFEDYLVRETQTVLTLVNTSNQRLRLKLTARIDGDNGLFAYSDPAFTPSMPIELGPLETRTFMPGSPELSLPGEEYIITNVARRQQAGIIASGVLPQGNYTFCIQALDYDTGEERSLPAPSGCVTVPISYLQPPVLIQPNCGVTVPSPWPTFMWSPPVGNPGRNQVFYDLYLLKLLPGQDPNQAMLAAVEYRAGNPLIFQDLPVNNYVYRASDPPLEHGATYAVLVRAHDFMGNLLIENQGRSEVCTFTYQEIGRQSPGVGQMPGNVLSQIQLPMTTVSGDIRYHFQGSVPDKPTVFSSSLSAPKPSTDLYQFAPYDEPHVVDPYLYPVTNTFPLANTKVKLVVRYLLKDYQLTPAMGENPPIVLANYLLPEDGHPYHPPDNGKTVAITYTDQQGAYAFQFPQLDSMIVLQDFSVQGNSAGSFSQDPFLSWSNTKPSAHVNDYFSQYTFKQLVRVLRLEVESPYYCSPEVNILVQPNQIAQVPTQVTKVKSYHLRVTAYGDTTKIGFSKDIPLQGAWVEILRHYNLAQNPPQDIPATEGENLDEWEGQGLFQKKVLAREETNSEGKVFIQHLVRHFPQAANDRYVIRGSTKEANTHLNFHPQTRTYPHPTPNYATSPDFPMSTNQTVYNSQYSPEIFETEITLQAAPPAITGRVVHFVDEALVPLTGVMVTLDLKPTFGGPDQFDGVTVPNDGDGYFEFEQLPVNYSGKVILYKPGYHQRTIQIDQLTSGKLRDLGEVALLPLGKVYGFVVNEANEGLAADVRIGAGPYVPTQFVNVSQMPSAVTKKNRNATPQVQQTGIAQTGGGFSISMFQFGAQGGINLPMTIEPWSDEYFVLQDTVDVDYASLDPKGHEEAGYQYLGVYTLRKKLHRVKFVVQNAQGSLISGARIDIQDSLLLTSQQGTAQLAFASPGQFFLVRVEGPAGSGYVSWYEEIEIPISQDFQTVEITLKQGVSVSGIVTYGPDSLPLADARVFVKSDFLAGNDFPIAETNSGPDGSFTLTGLPVDTLYQAGGQPVSLPLMIHAVKSDPQLSLVGDKVSVNPTKGGLVHLHLSLLELLSLQTIWGLPVEVESFVPDGQGGGQVTGAFVDLPSNPNFRMSESAVRLAFSNVQVSPGKQTGPNGAPLALPVQNAIETDQTELLVEVNDAYTARVYGLGYSNPSEVEWISISQDPAGFGQLLGHAGIELSSFNFAYQYQGKLLLGETPDETLMPIFSAANLPERVFHLMQRKRGQGVKNPGFQVHNFSAHGDRNQSYLRQDSVRLFSVLHTQIPQSVPADLEIKAGFITVLPSTIEPFSGGKKLSFQLEEWEFVAQSSWSYNKNLGAIVIPQAIIHTGKIDVPVKQVRLQPDDLDFQQPDLQADGLTLGGIIPLELLSSDFFFGYDPVCASDKQPHWRLTLRDENLGSVARFGNLPGAPGQFVALGSFTFFSNGEDIAGELDHPMTFYDILTVQLNQISTGQGFVTLSGSGDLGIPNLSKDLTTSFTFTRDAGGQLINTWNPLYFTFEGVGKVEFITNSTGQKLTQGLFESQGTIRFYEQGEEILLKGLLTKTQNACEVELVTVNGQNQVIQLGSVSNKMELLRGDMVANLAHDSWNFFDFDARLHGFNGVGPNSDPINFVVGGAITASDQGISITNIETPLGGLNLIFNFQEQSLFGHMSIKNLDIGPLGVKQGDFQILLDRKGYYFLVGATVNVPVIQTIGMAILVGDYPEYTAVMDSTFKTYSYNHQLPKGFEDGFSGFLFSGQWSVTLAENDGVDLGIFAIQVSASMGLDLRVSADFGSDAYELFVLGYANFSLSLSAGCATGYFYLSAELGLGAQIVNGNFDLIGCASIAAGIGFENCLPADPLSIFCLDACFGDCWSGSIRADMTWGESSPSPDFDISLGETCSGNKGPISVAGKTSPCN